MIPVINIWFKYRNSGKLDMIGRILVIHYRVGI